MTENTQSCTNWDAQWTAKSLDEVMEKMRALMMRETIELATTCRLSFPGFTILGSEHLPSRTILVPISVFAEIKNQAESAAGEKHD